MNTGIVRCTRVLLGFIVLPSVTARPMPEASTQTESISLLHQPTIRSALLDNITALVHYELSSKRCIAFILRAKAAPSDPRRRKKHSNGRVNERTSIARAPPCYHETTASRRWRLPVEL